MRKLCAVCGDGFDAKRSAAKYCGERCKKRAQRRPEAVVLALPSEAPHVGVLEVATLHRLEGCGRSDSELGAAALLLARRLDNSGTDTGTSVASLMREYRATLADAVRDAEAANDPLEEIRGSAALKLIAGGR